MCVESPDGRYLYIVTELSDEVLVLGNNDCGVTDDTPRLLQRIPVSKGHPQGGGHIALSPDGRTLYVSQRVSGTAEGAHCPVPDGVAVFRVNVDATLTPLTYMATGLHPRHFCLSADGCLLCVACRDDNTLRMYAIDPSSGIPGSQVDSRTIPAPVFVAWKGCAADIVQVTR